MIPNRYKYYSLLKKSADKIVFMNNLKEKLEHKKSRHYRKHTVLRITYHLDLRVFYNY